MKNKKFIIKNTGFTLIEMMVVLAVFLILIAIAVPAFRAFQRGSDAEATAGEIIGALHLAQNKTLASEGASQYGVYFDTSTLPHSYVLFKGSSYTLRDASFDKVSNLSSAMEISNLDLGGGKEVVFEKITGHTQSGFSTGSVSLKLGSNSQTLYINNSGLASLDPFLVFSDKGRLVDSRHIHFNHNRPISTSTEKIILDFLTILEPIPIANYMQGDQFSWEGTVNVDGVDQALKIHTHWLNAPDTEFCIHRDRRYNNKPLIVRIDGDASGSLVDYTASGDVVRGDSPNLTIGADGDPREQ